MSESYDAEKFRNLTGREPMQDDLARINCEFVGTPGHMACGVCKKCGQPAWMCEHFGESVGERMEAYRRD